jgi:hypothetical protein
MFKTFQPFKNRTLMNRFLAAICAIRVTAGAPSNAMAQIFVSASLSAGIVKRRQEVKKLRIAQSK